MVLRKVDDLKSNTFMVSCLNGWRKLKQINMEEEKEVEKKLLERWAPGVKISTV